MTGLGSGSLPASGSAIRAQHKIWRVAVVGNPNSGKTTLFNALTGLHHKVSNYPGVTVERREARLVAPGIKDAWIIDLPGAYSLIPGSVDEGITRQLLLDSGPNGESIDAVLIVVDAGNLERNLYFATQVIDLGLPVVLCCNMMDAVRARGQILDLQELGRRLGVWVVGTVGSRGEGISKLKAALAALGAAGAPPATLDLPAPLEHAVRRLADRIAELHLGRSGRERSLAMLLLDNCRGEAGMRIAVPPDLVGEIDQVSAELQDAGFRPPSAAVIRARFEFIRRVLQGLLRDVHARAANDRQSFADRADRWLAHPVLGLILFGAVMFVMFLAIFSWAGPLMDGIESAVRRLALLIDSCMADGSLRSLLVDGVLGGVGAVVVFVPQICMLFFFLTLLEDSGYLARAALVSNRLMRCVGLPGKSFIPLLSSFACAIPGIMATRTIENQRDRLVTILIAPFMSCSARLPVYTVLIGTLFAGSVWLQASIMSAMYLLGIAAALAVGFVLKRTVFKSPAAGFIIELPPYRWPRLGAVLRVMWERSVLFLKDAGSIIFAVSIILWALAYFPRSIGPDGHAKAAVLADSHLGHIGRALEVAIQPLGFDWKIGIGLAASFAAREVFVSTLGVVYGVGDQADAHSQPLREHIAADTWPDGRKIYTPLVAISLMVFYVLACQCVSTLGVVKRETHSWHWPAIMFAYMTALAYSASLCVYQVGSALGLNG